MGKSQSSSSRIYNMNAFMHEIGHAYYWTQYPQDSNSLEEEIARTMRINFLDIPAWKIRRYFDLKNFYEPLKNLTWIFLEYIIF